MKPIIWLGNSNKAAKSFPKSAKFEIGYNLERLQYGLDPADWKPISSVGHGVREIRVHLDCEYRVIYLVKYPEAIYILSAFIKKSRTATRNLKIAKQRYAELNIKRKQS